MHQQERGFPSGTQPISQVCHETTSRVRRTSPVPATHPYERRTILHIPGSISAEKPGVVPSGNPCLLTQEGGKTISHSRERKECQVLSGSYKKAIQHFFSGNNVRKEFQRSEKHTTDPFIGAPGTGFPTRGINDIRIICQHLLLISLNSKPGIQ
jgi:hypothetical protein